MSKSETSTWTMSAVQLITSTSSNLSVIDAVQAMITASVNWKVVSTGFTASNKKYVEIAPLLTSSYKNFRAIFLETAINNSSKTTHDGTSVTNRLAFGIYPDGGASYCTFTPARLEDNSGLALYNGSKYGTGWWSSISSPYTALWMYECNGAMWLVVRSGGTSHQLFGIGQLANFPQPTWQDWAEDGTELGVMGIYTNRGITTSMITGDNFLGKWGDSQFVNFRRTNSSSNSTLIYISNWASALPPRLSAVGSYSPYQTAHSTSIFFPLAGGHDSTFDQGSFVMRGQYASGPFKTRTTIKNAAGSANLGFTFYPEDTAAGWALCFMNS